MRYGWGEECSFLQFTGETWVDKRGRNNLAEMKNVLGNCRQRMKYVHRICTKDYKIYVPEYISWKSKSHSFLQGNVCKNLSVFQLFKTTLKHL